MVDTGQIDTMVNGDNCAQQQDISVNVNVDLSQNNGGDVEMEDLTPQPDLNKKESEAFEDPDNYGDEEGWDDYYGEEDLASPGLVRQRSSQQRVSLARQKSGMKKKVKNLDDMKPEIKKIVDKIADLLCLDEDKCIIIAKHFSWSFEKIQNNWFAESEKLEKELGFIPKPANAMMQEADDDEEDCPICYENPVDRSIKLDCGHNDYCKQCWQEQILERLNGFEDPTTIMCMKQGCPMKLPHSFILKLLQEFDEDPVRLEEAKEIAAIDKSKGIDQGKDNLKQISKVELYWKWLARSYTENNLDIKWCPKQGCGYCYTKDEEDFNSVDFTCRCGTIVCLICSQEAHAPCDCATARLWSEQQSNESENWIKRNTRPCPKCGCCIQKVSGCHFLVCRKCSHRFCWVCAKEWPEHNAEHDAKHKECDKKEKWMGFGGREEGNGDLKGQAQYHEYIKVLDRVQAEQKREMISVLNLAEELKKIVEFQVGSNAYTTQQMEYIPNALNELKRATHTLKWLNVFGFFAMAVENVPQQWTFWNTNMASLTKKLEDLLIGNQLFFNTENSKMVEAFMDQKEPIVTATNLLAKQRIGIVSDLQNCQ